MEAREGLFDKIVPPRLEDAGLEDCALPPDAIKEAFLKAATAVRSIISTSDDEDEGGHCLNDSSPKGVPSEDVLVGIEDGIDYPPGGCSTEKGGGILELPVDEVVVVGRGGKDEGKVDEVIGATLPEIGKSCVDGLQGLKIGERGSTDNKAQKSDDAEDEEEDAKERSI